MVVVVAAVLVVVVVVPLECLRGLPRIATAGRNAVGEGVGTLTRERIGERHLRWRLRLQFGRQKLLQSQYKSKKVWLTKLR